MCSHRAGDHRASAQNRAGDHRARAPRKRKAKLALPHNSGEAAVAVPAGLIFCPPSLGLCLPSWHASGSLGRTARGSIRPGRLSRPVRRPSRLPTPAPPAQPGHSFGGRAPKQKRGFKLTTQGPARSRRPCPPCSQPGAHRGANHSKLCAGPRRLRVGGPSAEPVPTLRPDKP